MGVWTDCGDFLREFRRDFHHTGALLPSGGFLAGELARALSGDRPPARILEVGPGTGSVTRAIARRMRPGDRLDAVEINPRFAELLTRNLASDPALFPHRARITVINAPLQEVPGRAVYDLVVSGLPLNNFSPADVRDIFDAYRRLLKPDGTLSYFEYAFLRGLRMPFVSRRERYRLARLDRLLCRYLGRHQVGRTRVWLNVPPAVVRRLRFAGTCEGSAAGVS